MTTGWGRAAPREGTDADFWASADPQAAKDAEQERREAQEQAAEYARGEAERDEQ